ncbi:uncharacterized protein LOC143357653 [Halictus rubicundus]|uniref:uncharacterized protein LOC143357653 n=1 Tax=Halictus rubicundus TaxID=77578 RepID=UPI004037017E
MSNYSYYYVKTIIDDADKPKTYKFLKGNPALFQPPGDTWSTHGRYNLLSRLLRGGLSGSGDVYHPGNAIFKVRDRFLTIRYSRHSVPEESLLRETLAIHQRIS